MKEVNRLLKDNIHRKKLLNVFFIDNDNLNNEELLYDNKHLKKDSGVRILVSNLKQSVLKSTTKHYDYNYRKIKHHLLKESKHEVSVNKDPPQSRSVDGGGGGGGDDSLIKVGTDVRRVQNLDRAKFPQKT